MFIETKTRKFQNKNNDKKAALKFKSYREIY